MKPIDLLRYLAIASATVFVASCGNGGSPQLTQAEAIPTTDSQPAYTNNVIDTVNDPSPEITDELNRQLIDAAWANDLDRAADLIASGADVNFKDRTVQSAYLIATSEGYRELLELTLQHGADVTSLDSYNGTGLIRSAERGHYLVVGRLIRAGIDVDHINRLSWTALHESIILGDGGQRYVDTVRVLIAGGVDLELASDGTTPLQHAEARNQKRIVESLTAALTAEQIDQPDEALLDHAANGDADGAALALRAGANVETRDTRGRTPLLLAAAADHVEVAAVLVALGADLDALDDRHDTPWLVTGVTGSVAMAEIMLAEVPGPDLTVLNRFGGTSLIPASERGHVDYVRRIAGTGIDVNHINNLGWTALLEAVILGDGSTNYVEIVNILLDHGADPTIPDKNGVTATQHARQRGHDQIAAALTRS
jgi:ankyrin repeat protein